jgi:3,4-dihydroxy 2-butanone 4-phosphate synthase
VGSLERSRLTMIEAVNEATRALREGLPVLIYDDASRENEVDYVLYAGYIDADVVYEMRTLAGGLICFAMPSMVASMLGIPFMHELLSKDVTLSQLVKLPRYGDWPAFSIWVNHVSVMTGIRDEDRATTIRELHNVVEMAMKGRADEARRKFYEEFMSPGHVPILIARRLSQRRGHTELAIYLAVLAGLTPSVVLAEMLKKGTALSLEEARSLSREYGYPLVSGNDIVKAVAREAEKVCRIVPC